MFRVGDVIEFKDPSNVKEDLQRSQKGCIKRHGKGPFNVKTVSSSKELLSFNEIISYSVARFQKAQEEIKVGDFVIFKQEANESIIQMEGRGPFKVLKVFEELDKHFLKFKDKAGKESSGFFVSRFKKALIFKVGDKVVCKQKPDDPTYSSLLDDIIGKIGVIQEKDDDGFVKVGFLYNKKRILRVEWLDEIIETEFKIGDWVKTKTEVFGPGPLRILDVREKDVKVSGHTSWFGSSQFEKCDPPVFKVGDTVQVCSKVPENKHKHPIFSPTMEKHCLNKIGKIGNFSHGKGTISVCFEEGDGLPVWFRPEWIKVVEKTPEPEPEKPLPKDAVLNSFAIGDWVTLKTVEEYSGNDERKSYAQKHAISKIGKKPFQLKKSDIGSSLYIRGYIRERFKITEAPERSYVDYVISDAIEKIQVKVDREMSKVVFQETKPTVTPSGAFKNAWKKFRSTIWG